MNNQLLLLDLITPDFEKKRFILKTLTDFEKSFDLCCRFIAKDAKDNLEDLIIPDFEAFLLEADEIIEKALDKISRMEKSA